MPLGSATQAAVLPTGSLLPTGDILPLDSILPSNILPREVESTKHTARQTELECPLPDGRFPIPGSCTQFIECTNSQSVTLSCPPGLYFNTALTECDYPDNAACTEAAASTTNTIAPRDDFECAEDGTFPVPEDSSQFYLCYEGTSQLQSCAPGLVFDADFGVCGFDWDDESDTASIVARQATAIQCPALFSVVPNTEDTTKYYQCVAGIPVPLSCPAGQLFDPVKAACA